MMTKFINTKILLIKIILETIHASKTMAENRLKAQHKEDWTQVLTSKNELGEITGYATEIFSVLYGSPYTSLPLSSIQKTEMNDCIRKDKQEIKILTDLENDKNVLQNRVHDYENKLKSIIGSDLTNWETKITKIGIGDKEISDLRKEITDTKNKLSDLTKQKEQADKKLQKKEQELTTKTNQIINHRCENPNQQELNQLKEELSKLTKEKQELKAQLEQKKDLPETPENNDNLTMEELKDKLNYRWKEIQDLKKQLKEQQITSKKIAGKTSPLSIVLFSISAVLGLISLISFYFLAKKKKKGNFKIRIIANSIL